MQQDLPKVNSWSLRVPPHIVYPPISLQGVLEESAQSFSEKAAVIFGGRTLFYSELDMLCNQFANALHALGIGKGDCIALYLPNIPQFIIAYFGTLKANATVTSISPLHREREVAFQLADSGAKTIVALDSLYPIVKMAREKIYLKHVIVTGLDEFSAKNASPSYISETLSFQQLLKAASPSKLTIPIDPLIDLAALQYTGGTTGTAKGAMLTHHNLVSNAMAFANFIQAKSNDTFLTALPLFHIYGMTTSLSVPISVGATIVLLPKFEPAKALHAITEYEVTVFCGVPTMYQMLLDQPDLASYDLSSIRVCISGASSLPAQVQKRFMDVTGGFLAEGYGLTEASPVTHCNPMDKTLPLKVGSIGLPLPDTYAKILDLKTRSPVLSIGDVGELIVKGPQVMMGYWRRPDETAAVLHDGWLLTGDIARIDSDGFFYIVDRKKDIIKHKDYSVYPRELEDVICEHPAVKLCAVVGKPDLASGQVPKAFVVLKEGATASAEELMSYVNTQVAPYKVIREIEFRSDLPISAAGKVLRRQLQNM